MELHILGRVLGLFRPEPVLEGIQTNLKTLNHMQSFAEGATEMLEQTGQDSPAREAEARQINLFIESSIRSLRKAEKHPWLSEESPVGQED